MSFIDFQDLIISEKITKLLNSTKPSDLFDAKNYKFEFQDYVTLLSEMLEMSVANGAEADNLLVIRDLI